MDTKEKERLAQEQMDQLKEALRDINSTQNIKVTNTGAVSGATGYEYADTITLSGHPYNNNTVIGGGYTVTTSLGATYPNAAPYYTTATSASGINWNNGANITANPWATMNASGKLKLEGDNADIEINGVSLLDLLRDRLNVMIPNPKLEKEWEQLRELGDQYRALEAKLKEQGEMWAKLKQTPPDPLY